MGKGFYDFSFSCLEDVRRVRCANTWNLKPGSLRLFPWSKDFVPSNVQHTSAQVWVCIHGLLQDYWQPKIIFTISSSLGMPICIDSTSSKSAFDRALDHFVRVLVDIDLTKELSYKILVERIGFAFFVDLEYERLSDFSSLCNCIGHSKDKCNRHKSAEGDKIKQKAAALGVKSHKASILVTQHTQKEFGETSGAVKLVVLVIVLVPTSPCSVPLASCRM